MSRQISGQTSQAEGCPTEEEIREICREIQRDWSERTRRSRAGECDDSESIEIARLSREATAGWAV
jgi:hypothetical protein